MNKNIITACLNMAVAISLGALGAHALKGVLTPEHLEAFKTAVLYHLIHSLALLVVFSSQQFENLKHIAWVGRLFNCGIILFCGSIYLLSTIDIPGFYALKFLGPVTPLGGLCFIGGWLWLAFTCIQHRKK